MRARRGCRRLSRPAYGRAARNGRSPTPRALLDLTGKGREGKGKVARARRQSPACSTARRTTRACRRACTATATATATGDGGSWTPGRARATQRVWAPGLPRCAAGRLAKPPCLPRRRGSRAVQIRGEVGGCASYSAGGRRGEAGGCAGGDDDDAAPCANCCRRSSKLPSAWVPPERIEVAASNGFIAGGGSGMHDAARAAPGTGLATTAAQASQTTEPNAAQF